MRELIINGIHYRIEMEPVIDLEANGTVMGQTDYPSTSIQLLKSLSKERKEQTLIHEALHAIFYEAGYGDHDEEMINHLTPVFYQFVKQNNLDKLFDEVTKN